MGRSTTSHSVSAQTDLTSGSRPKRQARRVWCEATIMTKASVSFLIGLAVIVGVLFLFFGLRLAGFGGIVSLPDMASPETTISISI